MTKLAIKNYAPETRHGIPGMFTGGYRNAQLEGNPWFTNMSAAFPGAAPKLNRNSPNPPYDIGKLLKRRSTIKPVHIGEPIDGIRPVHFNREPVIMDVRYYDYVIARFGDKAIFRQKKTRGLDAQSWQTIVVELDGDVVGVVMALNPKKFTWSK